MSRLSVAATFRLARTGGKSRVRVEYGSVMPRPHARMPAIFFGHGNPLNAIEQNAYTQAWSKVGSTIPRPKAILSISAHWYVPATLVTGSPDAPRTIHDFSGFPRKLYEVQYPAPGDRVLAEQVRQLLADIDVAIDESWGLDHGTWAVLCHVFPTADVPIVQLSIDDRQAPAFHYELGRGALPTAPIHRRHAAARRCSVVSG